MNRKVLLAIALVIFGCCSNVVFLELLIKFDTGAGNIITFFQFLVIAVEGLIFESRFFTKKPIIPVKYYAAMVSLFFTVSVVNNYCLHFNIPLPLHMIFRSGSLIANMILGILIMGKKYDLSKYLSILMISIGIAMATLASANQEYGKAPSRSAPPSLNSFDEEDDMTIETIEDDSITDVVEGQLSDFIWLCIGVFLLLVALFMSAALGVFQEKLYKKYGKHPKEAMFYTHALPLPLFLLMAPDLLKRVAMFNSSVPFTLGPVSVPSMWLYLIMNGITQYPSYDAVHNLSMRYICISGVFTLTTECPSLVVTLIITLRKFLSLLFSILYFQNPFTLTHWMGTILVFSGTLIFTEVLNPLAARLGLIATADSTPTTKETKKD